MSKGSRSRKRNSNDKKMAVVKKNSDERKTKKQKTPHAKKLESTAGPATSASTIDGASRLLDDFPVPIPGIAWASNSCYVDSTLYAMFSTTRIFDPALLAGNYSSAQLATMDPEDRKKAGRISAILTDIIEKNLRAHGYCSSEKVQALRNFLAAHFNPRLRSIMQDVDVFIATLFRRGLKLDPFIRYDGGTINFFHQIFLPANSSEVTVAVDDVQNLLEKSMAYSDLKFESIPTPALFIKMPRCEGKLQGFSGILPNLKLNLFSMMMENDRLEAKRQKKDGGHFSLSLLAVICLRSYHYTTFVRKGYHLHSPWYYFNSLGPSVNSVPDLGHKLHAFEVNYRQGKNVKNLDHRTAQILEDNHVCIYVPYVDDGGPFYEDVSSSQHESSDPEGQQTDEEEGPSSSRRSESSGASILDTTSDQDEQEDGPQMGQIGENQRTNEEMKTFGGRAGFEDGSQNFEIEPSSSKRQPLRFENEPMSFENGHQKSENEGPNLEKEHRSSGSKMYSFKNEDQNLKIERRSIENEAESVTNEHQSLQIEAEVTPRAVKEEEPQKLQRSYDQINEQDEILIVTKTTRKTRPAPSPLPAPPSPRRSMVTEDEDVSSVTTSSRPTAAEWEAEMEAQPLCGSKRMGHKQWGRWGIQKNYIILMITFLVVALIVGSILLIVFLT